MSEIATQAIIHDLFVLSCMALVMALGVYAVLRMGEGPSWNYDGEVLSRPYGWGDGVVVVVLLATLVWNTSAGSGPAQTAPEQAGNISMAMVLGDMVFKLLIVVVLLVFLSVRGSNPAELFGMRQMTVQSALFTAVGWLLVIFVASMVAINLIAKIYFGGSWPDNSLQEPVKAFLQAGPALKIMLAISAVIIAPVAEEIFFRGYLYGVVKSYSDRWFAALFSALIFAGVHSHVASLVPLFVLAMGLALAYESTGCLLVPMFMHAIFNGYNVSQMLAGHP